MASMSEESAYGWAFLSRFHRLSWSGILGLVVTPSVRACVSPCIVERPTSGGSNCGIADSSKTTSFSASQSCLSRARLVSSETGASSCLRGYSAILISFLVNELRICHLPGRKVEDSRLLGREGFVRGMDTRYALGHLRHLRRGGGLLLSHHSPLNIDLYFSACAR